MSRREELFPEVTAPDPRAVMLETFGREWSMEYTAEQLDLSWYPRGVKDLNP